MKILIINTRNRKDGNHSLPFEIDKDLSFSLKADSTLLKNGKPFFIPTCTNNCRIQMGTVVRISRLGKTISNRFAHRYYDAVTLGINITAEDLKEQLIREGRPVELSTNLDGSFVIGNFQPLQQGQNIFDREAKINIDEKTIVSPNPDNCCSVDEIIAYLSRFISFRQGDLMFIAWKCDTTKAEIGQHITGWMNDERILQFNMK